MKKIFTIFAALAVFTLALVLVGCPADDDDGQGGTTLKIKNESSYTLTNIVWNGSSFADISANSTKTMAVTAGIGAIRVSPATNPVSARTQTPIAIEENEAYTFTFTNNTVLLEEPADNAITLGVLASRVNKPVKPILRAGDKSIKVTWDAVNNAASYHVFYNTGTTPPDTPSKTENASSISTTIKGLTNGTTYYVWIQAVNTVSTSPLSDMAQAVPTSDFTADTAVAFLDVVDAINEATEGEYTITLTGNFSFHESAFVENGSKTITLTGGSSLRTIRHDGIREPDAEINLWPVPLFLVPNNITMILDDNITLDGSGQYAPDWNWSLVHLQGGTLEMRTGSTIKNGSEFGVGGSGTFTMNGGTISGNRVGGVNISGSGIFTMNSGTIRDNTANSSTQNFTRGGGGVNIGSSATFIMNGGTISGNATEREGGGVYVEGIFKMIDGMISGNSAISFGGGVFVNGNGGKFTKTGGTIDDTNTASSGKVASFHGIKQRNTTAGPGDNLDSNLDGSAGGWE